MPDPSPEDAFVRFVNVQKSYDGEILVVKDLNLDIAQGEFLTMLGPSGSGKTTCLMMLAGFETATHGDIILDQRPINNVAPHRREIGMVFQNYALFPHMTVAENLAFPLKVRKMSDSDIQQRVAKALDMVELGSFGGRRPGQLSGGQQQRVAVARALVFEPKLVLMDEPLGALDKQLREQMQYEIKHIHESLGVTVVYVTHDQSEALTMSNRVAVFNDGVIQQLASPEALYETPMNAFVAQFIGENNKLHGTIKAIDGSRCSIDIGDGGVPIHAVPVNVSTIGEQTTLSLRPERITIRPEPGSMENIHSAQVRELIYLGDHMRTRVTLLGHDDFVIKVANSAGHQHLKVGETVTVGWHADDCRALDRL
ncbi:MAG: putative spermidine/putrescine transport system ATP-binding protein [Gammaproteobacteria bacterium]|jgi:putative spermidine/putrescine transport system ATP-binding protein